MKILKFVDPQKLCPLKICTYTVFHALVPNFLFLQQPLTYLRF